MSDKYLTLKGGTYHYRRRVPTQLVCLIERPFWRESLHTGDITEARRQGARLNVDAEHQIDNASAELQRQRSTLARLTREEREVLEAAGGLDALRNATLGEPRPKSLIETGLRGEADLAQSIAEMLASSIPGRSRPIRDDSGEVEPELPEGPKLDQLRDELAEAEAKAASLRRRLERNLAILRKDATATDIPDAPVADATLQTVLARWARESKAPDQHVDQYSYAVRRFRELHGVLPLTDITRAHLRQFKDEIAKLPRSTSREIRKASLKRAIEIADKKKLPRIDDRTARKHVLALSTLLRHATSWGYIEQSPADGLRFVKPRAKISTASRRQGFTPEQLRALGTSLANETEDDRWIPIVAAYQGCRLEEIC
jgi:hypothetical protein